MPAVLRPMPGIEQSRVISAAKRCFDRLVLEVAKADFQVVYHLKDSLLHYQQAAIPALLELLRDTSFVKLQNTADLIYLGATAF